MDGCAILGGSALSCGDELGRPLCQVIPDQLLHLLLLREGRVVDGQQLVGRLPVEGRRLALWVLWLDQRLHKGGRASVAEAGMATVHVGAADPDELGGLRWAFLLCGEMENRDLHYGSVCPHLTWPSLMHHLR